VYQLFSMSVKFGLELREEQRRIPAYKHGKDVKMETLQNEELFKVCCLLQSSLR
jgi:hypothetical protein